jgi:hypothetical protein
MLEEIEGFVEVEGYVCGRAIAQNEGENAAHVERLSDKHWEKCQSSGSSSAAMRSNAPSSAPIRPEISQQD